MRAAAEAMRRVLVDHARAKRAAKRGGDWKPDRICPTPPCRWTNSNLIVLDRALAEFAAVDPEAAELVQLRSFHRLNHSAGGRGAGYFGADGGTGPGPMPGPGCFAEFREKNWRDPAPIAPIRVNPLPGRLAMTERELFLQALEIKDRPNVPPSWRRLARVSRFAPHVKTSCSRLTSLRVNSSISRTL